MDPKTAEELRSFLDVLRAAGVTRFKSPALEVDLGPPPPQPAPARPARALPPEIAALPPEQQSAVMGTLQDMFAHVGEG